MTNIADTLTRTPPLYTVEHDALQCFVCGKGASAGALEGSGHADDWAHPECLATPIDWEEDRTTRISREDTTKVR